MVNGYVSPFFISRCDHISIFVAGSKSPGLIVLEHELSDMSVASFIAAYPVIKANNWTMKSVAQLADGQAFRPDTGNGTGILAHSYTTTSASASINTCVLINIEWNRR